MKKKSLLGRYMYIKRSYNQEEAATTFFNTCLRAGKLVLNYQLDDSKQILLILPF